jgi:hypothetical protein
MNLRPKRLGTERGRGKSGKVGVRSGSLASVGRRVTLQNRPFERTHHEQERTSRDLAMQKVVGSSPIIRS